VEDFIDFDGGISFNYLKFITNPKYFSYYGLRRDDYMKLSLFYNRGFWRDKFIKQIVIQDFDIDFETLDIAVQFVNEAALKLFQNFYSMSHAFNILLFDTAPR